MTRLFLVLAAMFLGGCNAVENSHKKWQIVNDKRMLIEDNTTKYGASCVNIKTGLMMAKVEGEFWVIVANRELVADPNSMKVILSGIADIETGGVAGAASNLTKKGK